ncbi:hypothetical protein BL243_12305 [Ralstonia solanacearum]|nr:hypothetical protein BL243_12305 [Ralstonia solanacearum]
MTEDEYITWTSEMGWDWGQKTQTLFGLNSRSAQLAAQEHPFFSGLASDLKLWEDQELKRTGASLLMNLDPPKLESKPYGSVRNKSYRKNHLLNTKFPNEPDSGWITPENVFEKINDLVRGTLVCKYVDGPQRLAQLLTDRAQALDLRSKFDAEGREQGYYAYHFYVYIPVDVANDQMETATKELSVEVQLSTQLQEVLRKVTHDFYEEVRDQIEEDAGRWKWEIETNRFRAGYVSHTLHLLEAIIVQLRNDAHANRMDRQDANN